MFAFVQATQAIVRGISASFRDATVLHAPATAIDLMRAKAQHAEYVAALRAAGLAIREMPPLDDYPDACFVEDCVLLADGTALMTNPGAPSRRGEVPSVAEFLAPMARVERTHAPATIDGGDCLRVGSTWFVGRSARTNAHGAARVREVFGPLGYTVVEVPVVGLPRGEFLHLKCVASRIDDRTVLVAEDTVDRALFAARGLEVVTIPFEEAYAANTLVVNGTALVAKGYPHARAALERRGLRMIELALSEIAKADGSLTCMSVLR